MESDAIFSDCGMYRYMLSRKWGNGPIAVFIMLNPSKADHKKNDHTISKLVGFTKRWDYGGFFVGNLFAYCSTQRAVLSKVEDPVGPLNQAWLDWLLDLANESNGKVICAWGCSGRLMNREKKFLSSFPRQDLYALRLTKKEAPEHPLHIPYSCTPLMYRTGSKGEIHGRPKIYHGKDSAREYAQKL